MYNIAGANYVAPNAQQSKKNTTKKKDSHRYVFFSFETQIFCYEIFLNIFILAKVKNESGK